MNFYNQSWSDFSVDDAVNLLEDVSSRTTMQPSAKIILLVTTTLAISLAIVLNVVLMVTFLKAHCQKKRLSSLSSLRSSSLFAPATGFFNSPVYVLVILLAGNDILVAVINGGLVFLNIANENEWILGDMLSKLRDPLLHWVVGNSCSLMAVIAWERRSRLISQKTFSQRLRKLSINRKIMAKQAWQKAIAIGLIVASVNLVVAIPGLVNSTVLTATLALPYFDFENGSFDVREYSMGRFCVQNWFSPLLFVVYKSAVFTLTFLVPLLATLGIHLHVIAFLNKPSAARVIRSRLDLSRSTAILVSVVLSFACCWMPHQIASLVVDIHASGLFESTSSSALGNIALSHIFVCLKLLTLFQASLNPILYGYTMYRRRDNRASSLIVEKTDNPPLIENEPGTSQSASPLPTGQITAEK